MAGEDAPARYLGGRVERLQPPFPPRFADAEASLETARFVILGLPYDRTATYRYGARQGPAAIRQASWNLESYNLRHRLDLARIPVHDAGDADVADLTPEKMALAVEKAAGDAAGDRRFLVGLGGEHSVTPAIVKALAKRHDDLAVLHLDAHLDYRAEHGGTPYNHASALRRIVDVVGPERVATIGVRSAEEQELKEAERDGVRFFTSFDVRAKSMSRVLDAALAHLDSGELYLTLDVDALDPAHAPGTGTPETFGLTPWDVLHALTRAADRLVGFDVVEVAPAWDNGNTAVLAARLVREAMAEVVVRFP